MKSNPYRVKNRENKPRIHKSRSSFFHSDNKDLYVDSYGKKSHKAWQIPLFAALMILLTVFSFGPNIADRLAGRLAGNDNSGDNPELIYFGKDYAVVSVSITDLLKEPDLRSVRISQVLYNEPFKVIGRQFTGFIQVELDDGSQGYVMTRDVTKDTTSVEPGNYKHKLTVTARTKRIMSHASQGSMLAEVPMGAVLFADQGGEGVYRVALSGGGYGWVSSEGIVRTDVRSSPLKSNAVKFCETALLFANSTYIDNGVTVYGASSHGIAFISAKVNGLSIPRDLNAQSQAGFPVSFGRDEETGLPDFADLLEGDLVFFGDETIEGNSAISGMGIMIGYGRALMTATNRNSVKIIDLTSNDLLALKLVSARRLFTQQ